MHSTLGEALLHGIYRHTGADLLVAVRSGQFFVGLECGTVDHAARALAGIILAGQHDGAIGVDPRAGMGR